MMVGTMTGFLAKLTHEEPTPWKESLMHGVLNGFFTVGVYAGIRFFWPEISVNFGVAMSAAISTVGRNLILRIAIKVLK